MSEPTLKWQRVESQWGVNYETLLLDVDPQGNQRCYGVCGKQPKEPSSKWALLLIYDPRALVSAFETEFYCPDCLQEELARRNRMKECRLDVGEQRASKCADEKARQEGEEDHKPEKA